MIRLRLPPLPNPNVPGAPVRLPHSSTRSSLRPPESRIWRSDRGDRTLLDDLGHYVRERVDFFEGGVDVRRDSKSLVFAGRDDGDGPNAVLFPEIGRQLGRLKAIHA